MRAQEHNGARSPLQQRLYLAAAVTLPALLGCLALFFALRHRPDPYWEEALGKERPGLGLMQGLRTGFRDPAASAALRLLFVGNSFVHRNEGAETVCCPPYCHFLASAWFACQLSCPGEACRSLAKEPARQPPLWEHA